MDYQDIRFELADGIAVVTLHRPDRLNAFTGRMGKELTHAYERCDADDDVRVVILTGAGRAFCVGVDMSSGEHTFEKQASPRFSATPTKPAWEVRKPVIAALNGHAVGIGLTLALHCDVRFAAEDAKYGVLQVRRGVMPDACSHWTLPRIIGMERAASLLLTGRKVTGAEAERLGMVLQALPADRVLGAAREMARDIVENTAPLSVGITKQLLWQSLGLDPDEVEFLETGLHHVLMGAPDAVEGPMAWIERRKPKFTATISRDWPKWPDLSQIHDEEDDEGG